MENILETKEREWGNDLVYIQCKDVFIGKNEIYKFIGGFVGV